MANGENGARRPRHAPGRGRRHVGVTEQLLVRRSELWVLEHVRRHGTGWLVATVTVIIVVVSGAATLATLVAIDGFDRTAYWVAAVALSTLTPALSAPPGLRYTIRLVARLDVAVGLLHEVAVTDTLTGVLNRRGFFEALPGVGAGEEVEVAMADVDRFKELNDGFGHDAGDRALRRVGEWLQATIGEHGAVGRLGGDEFAFVVPVRHAPALGHRHVVDVDGIACTVTIGRVRCPAGASRELALVRADAELYRCKADRDALAAGGGVETASDGAAV